MSKFLAPVVALALVGSIALANWLTTEYGLVTAGFGLMVTAGTYAAGLALGLRDALHHLGGVWWVAAAIAGGIAASALLGDGHIALASAVAFGVAELLDLLVYMPLRRRGWRRGVIGSNAVGAMADTFLFLYIAGFPVVPESVGGQLLVKAVWMTVLALVIGEGIVRARRATV